MSTDVVYYLPTYVVLRAEGAGKIFGWYSRWLEIYLVMTSAKRKQCSCLLQGRTGYLNKYSGMMGHCAPKVRENLWSEGICVG